MLNRLLGPDSTVSGLKAGLDASSRTVRGIAHRIANASTPGGPSFQNTLDEAQAGAAAGPEAVDVEAEMVRLADEQLRFEASTQLLQKLYQQIRSSVREG